MEFKKAYLKAAAKHKLPKFDDIDHIFELKVIDRDSYVLRDTRRRMIDKLDHFVKILEGLINPETTISGLHECKFFTDEEKTRIFNLYRVLMSYLRQADILSLSSDDKAEALFINQLFKDWPKLEAQLREIITKIRKTWIADDEAKDVVGYFG